MNENNKRDLNAVLGLSCFIAGAGAMLVSIFWAPLWVQTFFWGAVLVGISRKFLNNVKAMS